MLKIEIEKRETKSAIDKWLRELDQITNPSLRERLERGLVSKLIDAKANFGLGIAGNKKSIKWTDQLAEELHRPTIKNFERGVYM